VHFTSIEAARNLLIPNRPALLRATSRPAPALRSACERRGSAFTFDLSPLPFLRIRKTSAPEVLSTEIALKIAI
jgi:hypothetical protein